MKPRRRAKPGTIATLYSVPELAALSGQTRQSLHRLIVREQMRVVRCGRTVLVPISAFSDAFPEIWDAILTMRGLTAGSTVECSACGSEVRL